jgi:DNA-binding NarL/FixJ family response regulator
VAVQIAVFDPLPAYRRGIMTTVEDAGFDCEAPEDLLAWINDLHEKVILLTLQSAEDWALLTALGRTQRALIVAAIVDTSTSSYVRALTSGAVGVMPRDATPAEVRDTVEAVTRSKCILPIDVLRALTGVTGDSGSDKAPSSREIDWLRRIAEGESVANLAAQVGYSERMMFRLLRDLYDRLQVKGRTEALMLGRQEGWL